MRILLCMPEYPPDSIGGGGAVAKALLAQYSKRHDVRVLTGRIGVAEVPDTEPASIVRIDEYPYPRAHPYMASTMPPKLQSIPTIVAAVKDCDVAHVHGYGFPLMDVAAIAARMRHMPVVKTLHGFPVTPAKRGGLVHTAFRTYATLLGDPALRLSSSVTAVSETVASFYARNYSINCRVIANGVTDLPDASPSAAPDPHFFTILCVGRLEWLKRFDTVVQALARVPDTVRLRIAGRDNGELENLRALAARLGVSDRVEFLGYLRGQELADTYAAADCCVMSSETEAFPAVPLEAMRFGIPAIVTPVGGTLEYGKDRENLLFYPIGDDGALAGCIEALRTSEPLRQVLVQRGRETATRYTWTTVANQYEEIFESVVRRH